MRGSDKKAMAVYQHPLFTGTEFKTGNAIVRNYTALDETHFAIEQRISICVQELGASWAGKSFESVR
jgi:hypothetical protein